MFNDNYLYINNVTRALFKDTPFDENTETISAGATTYSYNQHAQCAQLKSELVNPDTTQMMLLDSPFGPTWLSEQSSSVPLSSSSFTAEQPDFTVFPSFDIPLQQQQQQQQQPQPAQFLLFQSYFPVPETEQANLLNQPYDVDFYCYEATMCNMSNDTTPSLISNPTFSPVASSTTSSSSRASTSPTCPDLSYWPTLSNRSNNNTYKPQHADHQYTVEIESSSCCGNTNSNTKKEQPCTVTNKPTKQTQQQQQQQRERSYVCKTCSFAFVRKHDLHRHSRVHTGIKPYSCPSCHKAFARTDALKRHLRLEVTCRMDPIVQQLKQTGARRYRNL